MDKQMPTTPTNPTPQPTQPQPAQGGMGWGAILAGIIALALVAGGVYYFLSQGGTVQPAVQTPSTSTQENSVDTILSDLNAGGSADTSADLNNLEQSL